MATAKKSLFFDTEEPRESTALNLLKKTQRKSTQLVTLAVLEFAEKYGLHGKEQRDILQFIHNYDYICKNIESRPIQIIQSSSPYIGNYAGTQVASPVPTPPPVQTLPHTEVQKETTTLIPQNEAPAPQRGPSVEEKKKHLNKLMAGFQVPDE